MFPNSNRNRIQRGHIPTYRTLTLALNVGTDHYHEYRSHLCVDVTLSLNLTIALTLQRKTKCTHEPILSRHLTEPLPLNHALTPEYEHHGQHRPHQHLTINLSLNLTLALTLQRYTNMNPPLSPMYIFPNTEQ